MNGIVFDIQRFSLHDGPGIRTTVFLKGCRLRCKWCQNPEGLTLESCGAACPESELTSVGREMSEIEAADVVERDKVFYETSGGGVTLSGGDPTVQSKFSGALLKECRKRGIHTAVETSMMCNREDLDEILPHTDLFLLDLKIMDPEEHRRWTGKDNTLIKQNFERLCGEDVRKIVRVALIPEITATRENIRAIADYVASVDASLPVELLNFNPVCRSKYEKMGMEFPVSNARMLSDSEMDEFSQILRDAGCKVYGDDKQE